MDEFIATFHIDWKLMLAQVINFGLVFFALYMLAAKPLKKLVEERTTEINTGLLNAKENAELLKASKQEYETMLTQARIEANTLFQAGKKEAEVYRADAIEKARNEAKTILDNTRKTLEGDKQKIVNEAKNEIASLALLAAEKIMQSKNIDKNK